METSKHTCKYQKLFNGALTSSQFKRQITLSVSGITPFLYLLFRKMFIKKNIRTIIMKTMRLSPNTTWGLRIFLFPGTSSSPNNKKNTPHTPTSNGQPLAEFLVGHLENFATDQATILVGTVTKNHSCCSA